MKKVYQLLLEIETLSTQTKVFFLVSFYVILFTFALLVCIIFYCHIELDYQRKRCELLEEYVGDVKRVIDKRCMDGITDVDFDKMEREELGSR